MYVCSSLLYGAAMWGVDVVACNGNLSHNCSSTMGVFYRWLFQATLGLHHRARNEIVYVLSGCLPLSLYIGKVLIHYTASLQGSDRLFASAVAWVSANLDDGAARHLSI